MIAWLKGRNKWNLILKRKKGTCTEKQCLEMVQKWCKMVQGTSTVLVRYKVSQRS